MNLYFSLAAITLALMTGWITHTWYDGYKTKNQAIYAEHRAAAGEVKIIHDVQVITKVVTHEKDTCINKPVPADLLKQLR